MFGIPSTTPTNLFLNQNDNNDSNNSNDKSLNKKLFTFNKNNTQKTTSELFNTKPILFSNFNECNKSNNTIYNSNKNTTYESSENSSLHTSLNNSFENNPIYNNTIENNTKEINSLKNTIDNFKKDIDEIKKFTKLQVKTNYETGIYVKCTKHNHLLKECTISELSDIYNNGFCCDCCHYKQQNINEKFYHCNECSSISGLGNYDLCFNCVNNSF